jgi:hypothetical protein
LWSWTIVGALLFLLLSVAPVNKETRPGEKKEAGTVLQVALCWKVDNVDSFVSSTNTTCMGFVFVWPIHVNSSQ